MATKKIDSKLKKGKKLAATKNLTVPPQGAAVTPVGD